MLVHSLRARHSYMHQALAAACLILFFAFSVFGQGLTTAGIRGRVTDPSGAAIAGVTVTATSPALLVAQVTTEADADGDYKFAELPIGTYSVTFQAKGFQQLVRANVVLTAG